MKANNNEQNKLKHAYRTNSKNSHEQKWLKNPRIYYEKKKKVMQPIGLKTNLKSLLWEENKNKEHKIQTQPKWIIRKIYTKTKMKPKALTH